MNDNPYKIAYEREKKARELAERLLEQKTRELYQHCIELEEAHQHLTSTQKKLIQSDKMSSLGQLAAGVAHEINNPLSYALCNMEFLANYFETFKKLDYFIQHPAADDSEVHCLEDYKLVREKYELDYINQDGDELIASTVEGLKKIEHIISSLKQVTHQNSEKNTRCNINESIESSLKVVWNELKYTMEVETHLAEVPLVAFDNGEIHQVLMNLFINAKHACEPKGKLIITSSLDDLNDEIWVKIEIADNGTGIPPDIIERIFEPFYTTKQVGKGTGLGLSISLNIIESNGGKLEVISQLGKGANFIIYLKPV